MCLAALLSVMLGGCASDTSEEEPSGSEPAASTGAEKTPSPTPTVKAELSEYPACPTGLADALNSASSGGNAWVEVPFETAPMPDALDLPVPSCTYQRGAIDWTHSYYVGAGQELFDSLAASLTSLGVPEYVSDYQPAGSKTWGTESTGFLEMTMIAPGDTSTIVGPSFAEPALDLSINGTPIP